LGRSWVGNDQHKAKSVLLSLPVAATQSFMEEATPKIRAAQPFLSGKRFQGFLRFGALLGVFLS